ncbi:MAG TPA: sigma-54-dependent Fis family transcriptional regulator [Myxococcales bacterium]|nr:sigma-54-dependent Fis family transcriptional regulator [Myxococcales bacterium]
MLDYEKYQSLHTIIMLKDVIRKWWRVELSFADKNGLILDRREGAPMPPQNDFCRLSLFCKEGNRRCTQSVRVLLEKFKASKKLRSCMFHECHLGFSIVGAPLYLNGEYEGSIFVEGFLRQQPSEREFETLRTKISQLNNGATDLERALQRAPMMVQPEIDKLSDLLEFAVNEIANFESEVSKREEHIQTLSDELSERYRFENIVGRSGPMQEVFRLLEKVCQSESTVLINGESGTGKELVARAIHFNGPRKDKPFVVQNCSAFNDNLLESALFGHVKGSFTGAVRDKKGLFEVADGGTFFLDEVGDMSPALQVKLLRVLQEGEVRPVGEDRARKVDVRILAATHRDLKERVASGQFREDLFYRLNVVHLAIPPLRERPEDIRVLARHFLARFAERFGVELPAVSDALYGRLAAWPWPGNVRELENAIERMVALSPDGELDQSLLPEARETEAGPRGLTLKQRVEAYERGLIVEGLKASRGNRSEAARALGISRVTLHDKLRKYGLARAEEPEG